MLNRRCFGLLPALLMIFLSCSNDKTADNAPPENSNVIEQDNQVSEVDTTLAGQYFIKGEQFAKEAKFDSAIVYFTEASKGYEEVENWEKYVRCYNKMGQCAFQQTALPAAEEYFNHAVEVCQMRVGERHPEIATSYRTLSIINFMKGNVPEGKRLMEASLDIRLEAFGENHLDVANSYIGMGDVTRFLGQFEQAQQYYNKALVIHLQQLGEEHPEVGTNYSAIGDLFFQKGEFNKAIKNFTKALEIRRKAFGEEHPQVAISYRRLGDAYYQKGDPDKASEYHNKSLTIRLAIFGEQHMEVAENYNQLAGCYWYKGDHEQAIVYMQKALSIRLAMNVEQHPETGRMYVNLGILYSSLGDHDRAIEYFRKGITITRELLGEKHIFVAENYGNMGLAYSKKGDYDRAIEFAQKAIRINKDLIGEMHPTVAREYEQLGTYYRHKKNYKEAFNYYNKALAISQKLLDARHPDFMQCYNQIALTHAEQGNYDLALQAIQKAINLNVPAFDDKDPYANPPLENIISEGKLLNSLEYKADILTKRFADQSHDRRDIQTAVETYRLTFQLLDQIRTGYKAEGSKLVFAENTHKIYDKAIQASHWLFQITGEPAFKKLCFQFAEKSKTGMLLEALNEAEARQFAGIPDTLLAQERDFRIELAYYEKNIADEQLKGNAADSSQLSAWQNELFDLKRSYDMLLLRFEQDYPEYHRLKYQFSSASLQDIQTRLLDENTALLEYFVGQDSIYIFLATQDQLRITPVAKDAAFRENISVLRAGITGQDFPKYADAAHYLYQALLLPVEKWIEGKSLLIIPDGALSYLPFEALLTAPVEKTPGVKDYRAFPYLIKQHSVSYAYSATLLLEILERQRHTPGRDYLAYAPVFEGGIAADTRSAEFVAENRGTDSTRMPFIGSLPSSRNEVLDIQGLFNKRYGLFERWFGEKSAVFLEKQASEKTLKTQSLDEYHYLHFATHGFINEERPKLSGLLFAADNTPDEDGILHLGEIYNLSLNADLVVLSACETGLGKIARGEGLIGLARGFLYAGAQNLLVSLWQVNDASTSQLMIDFYENMLDGESKSAALRDAKLGLIENDPKYAAPYYWAPFVLIGQ